MKTLVFGVLIGSLAAQAGAQVPMPSNEAIDQAMKELAPLRAQIIGAQPLPGQNVGPVAVPGVAVPDLRAASPALPPTPAPAPTATSAPRKDTVRRQETGLGTVPPHLLAVPAAPIDLDKMANEFEEAMEPLKIQHEEFYLFASFSIPNEKLMKFLQMAGEAKATVVFRGGLDDTDISMQKLARRLMSIRVRPMPKIQINPPLFTRFKVETIPAWVVAMPESANEDAGGCAPPATYASVAGDVRPEYALSVMSQRAIPAVAKVAETMLRRQEQRK